MPDDDLLARIERLEEDNRRLSELLGKLTAPDTPEPDEGPVNRRGLLKRTAAIALGVTAATAAGQVLSATPAAAADGQPILMGRRNDSPNPTSYFGAVEYGPALESHNEAVDGRGLLAKGTRVGIHAAGDQVAGVLGVFPRSATASGYYRAGVAGVGAGSQGAAAGVMGDSDSATGVVGSSNSGTGVMGSSNSAPGVIGTSNSAAGVVGQSKGTAGVRGQCDNDRGYGVFGEGSQKVTGVGGFSSGGTAVHGHSEEGRGVVGVCDQMTGGDFHAGVHGVLVAPTNAQVGTWLGLAGVLGDSRDYPGVRGLSTNHDGVCGDSMNARGGAFAGGAAAVRLVPGSAATPPAGGLTGDLYVDSTGRLWYCRSGNWVNLA